MSDWRLVLVTMAYLMVVVGMWLTASPWRMRDWIEYLTANEGRFKKVCIARAARSVAFGFRGDRLQIKKPPK